MAKALFRSRPFSPAKPHSHSCVGRCLATFSDPLRFIFVLLCPPPPGPTPSVLGLGWGLGVGGGGGITGV